MKTNEEADRLRRLKSICSGPDELEEVLRAGAALPAVWRSWSPNCCLIFLRSRLEFTQEELAAKAGVTQAVVSRIEGGAAARLTTWSKLFQAMGFKLSLLPLSDASIKELRKRAERGRPSLHWLRQRARPRRLISKSMWLLPVPK